VQGTIAVTDTRWYEFLQERQLQEVNFWTPSDRRPVRAEPLSPFLFKLKAPHNAICGFGYFARWASLPDWLAWECFDEGNGCESLEELRRSIAQIRDRIGYIVSGALDNIGCILIVQPTFFPPSAWVQQPSDWPARTQTRKRYELDVGEGRRVWETYLARAAALGGALAAGQRALAEHMPRYGAHYLVAPRLGQGTFRVAVTDAYGRACAVTGEHSLPVLEAAHLKPYAKGGLHEVRNGVLLRADLHRLFDQGYVTVTPEYWVEVSPRLRVEYQNGRSYYPFHGAPLQLPAQQNECPDPVLIGWHKQNIYLR